jgi:hypothetical protein
MTFWKVATAQAAATLVVDRLRKLGEGSAQRLQAGSSLLDYCVSEFSFSDDWSHGPMIYTCQVPMKSVPGSKR